MFECYGYGFDAVLGELLFLFGGEWCSVVGGEHDCFGAVVFGVVDCGHCLGVCPCVCVFKEAGAEEVDKGEFALCFSGGKAGCHGGEVFSVEADAECGELADVSWGDVAGFEGVACDVCEGGGEEFGCDVEEVDALVCEGVCGGGYLLDGGAGCHVEECFCPCAEEAAE